MGRRRSGGPRNKLAKAKKLNEKLNKKLLQSHGIEVEDDCGFEVSNHLRGGRHRANVLSQSHHNCGIECSERNVCDSPIKQCDGNCSCCCHHHMKHEQPAKKALKKGQSDLLKKKCDRVVDKSEAVELGLCNVVMEKENQLPERVPTSSRTRGPPSQEGSSKKTDKPSRKKNKLSIPSHRDGNPNCSLNLDSIVALQNEIEEMDSATALRQYDLDGLRQEIAKLLGYSLSDEMKNENKLPQSPPSPNKQAEDCILDCIDQMDGLRSKLPIVLELFQDQGDKDKIRREFHNATDVYEKIMSLIQSQGILSWHLHFQLHMFEEKKYDTTEEEMDELLQSSIFDGSWDLEKLLKVESDPLKDFRRNLIIFHVYTNVIMNELTDNWKILKFCLERPCKNKLVSDLLRLVNWVSSFRDHYHFFRLQFYEPQLTVEYPTTPGAASKEEESSTITTDDNAISLRELTLCDNNQTEGSDNINMKP